MVPLAYSVRSVLRRRTTYALTLAGVAAVVAIFVGMFAVSRGMSGALADTGDPRTVIVLGRSTMVETASAIEREQYAVMKVMPEVAHDGAGRALASPEVVAVWAVTDREGKYRQVPMRGITDGAFAVRRNVRIVAGRAPVPAMGEVIVGAGLRGQIEGLDLGGKFRWGRREWTVVGAFTAAGTAFESEVWGDVDGVLEDDNRTHYSLVAIRVDSPAAADSLIHRIDADRRLASHAQLETDYFRMQAGSAAPVTAAAFVTAILMGIAAVFGALTTIHASLAHRLREIAVLRALGFRRGGLVLSLIGESLLVTLPAGALGCLLVLAIDHHPMTMTNVFTFSAVSFRVEVTLEAVAAGLGFAALIGIAAGTWPAWAATRGSIPATLRA
jgi:ABC-type lipoprotein release transport system permease subunit